MAIEQAFEVKTIAISRMKPNPQQWRTHPKEQTAELAASIEAHGWLQGPIWNKRTKHIIDGHERVEWARTHGVKQIPVHVVDVSEADERHMLAVIDRIKSMRGRDTKTLAHLLAGIREREGDTMPSEWAEEEDTIFSALADGLEVNMGQSNGDGPPAEVEDVIPEEVTIDPDGDAKYTRVVQLIVPDRQFEDWELEIAQCQTEFEVDNPSDAALAAVAWAHEQLVG